MGQPTEVTFTNIQSEKQRDRDNFLPFQPRYPPTNGRTHKEKTHSDMRRYRRMRESIFINLYSTQSDIDAGGVSADNSYNGKNKYFFKNHSF